MNTNAGNNQPRECERCNTVQPSAKERPCCRALICVPCHLRATMTTMGHSFWASLLEDDWLPCPFTGCMRPLGATDVAGLRAVYIAAGCSPQDIEVPLRLFARANGLRAKIRKILKEDYPLTRDIDYALTECWAFHRRLAQSSYMLPLLTRIDDPEGEKIEVEALCVQPKGIRPPRSLPTHATGAVAYVRVAVVTGLLNRRETTRECGLCAEDLADLNHISPATWRQFTRDYGSDAEWLADNFPEEGMLPKCALWHSLDVCKLCLCRHVRATLDRVGPRAAGNIKCPAEGCDHVFTNEELESVLDHATFALLERAAYIDTAGKDPNFRWCLGPRCGAGRPYPETSVKIDCRFCGYKMCFRHQLPWHEGLTCEQFDVAEAARQRDEGDNNASAIREWLAANVKSCPGCMCPCEKNEGCYHMTCRHCGYEFCWECLADWSRIWTARGYNRLAHAEGCYFRGPNVPRPIFVNGNDLANTQVGNEDGDPQVLEGDVVEELAQGDEENDQINQDGENAMEVDEEEGEEEGEEMAMALDFE